MPFETVPGTGLTYCLIAFDAAGRERRDDPDGLMSERVMGVLGSEPITDVFLMSHGWKGDIPAAREQYDNWIGAMAKCTADIERAKNAPRGFVPLLVGIHWPSLPWGEEELGSSAVSFGLSEPNPIAALIDQYAERLSDSPAARAALQTIIAAAVENAAPSELPPDVRAAYQVLDREASLGDGGVAAAPGADREPFDPDRAYQAAQDEFGEGAASFGALSFMGGLLDPLRQLSFWKMKDRARLFGESGGTNLLAKIQRATVTRDVRVHLMGHSFGCIVMSATLAGPEGRGSLVRPVNSVAMIQGALSFWSYCSDIPYAKGKPGYFQSIVADRRVAGPIITTQSVHDTAVGKLYPLAAGAARQVVFAPGELPKYGALGSYGVRGPGPEIEDREMLAVKDSYRFAPGKVYNLESSQFICEGSGASGAHSDIAKPEVAHAVWEAALG